MANRPAPFPVHGYARGLDCRYSFRNLWLGFVRAPKVKQLRQSCGQMLRAAVVGVQTQ